MASGFMQRFKGKIVAQLITMTSPNGQMLQSVQNGVVAHSGGGQALATPLTAMACFISTVAVAGDSLLLPMAVPGMELSVINQTANAPNIFPFPGQAINALGANASIPGLASAQGGILMFYCGIAGQWWTK